MTYCWNCNIFFILQSDLTNPAHGDRIHKEYSEQKSSPTQNGRHFANNIFKCIFLNENVRISIQILLIFVAKGSIDNKSALVQTMAWRRTGHKPLPEPILAQFTDAYMRH